jgi:predicted Zn-dependent protease
VELGLKNLPESAKLHFERGMFLTLLDGFDEAKSDFDLARKLAPESDTAYLAGAQEAMFEGNIAGAIRTAREGIRKGHENFMLLTLLGEALLRSGIAPGQKEFEEARDSLERAVARRPSYPTAQLALGKLYLLDNQTGNAVAHFEAARQLNPENPSVYSNLATAYSKQGDVQKAQDALAILAKLNQAQADRIRNAPGDRKASYAEK